MALQHPRPSSLHCRCGMAEDRPHATEPCPRSSGQAHGQEACPQMRLTGKRPLCRRFNSTTRGPTQPLLNASEGAGPQSAPDKTSAKSAADKPPPMGGFKTVGETYNELDQLC